MPFYDLNRGINKPVEFKGLVGKNIYFLVIGIILTFVLFVGSYIAGAPLIILMPLIFVFGGGMWFGVFALNRKYGEHGLMKASARRSSPKYITNRQSRLFQHLNEDRAGRV